MAQCSPEGQPCGVPLRSQNLRQDIGSQVRNDGRVDDNDLSILLTNWGTGTDWAHGNFKGSGVVDDNDLSMLLSNWTGSAAVPEPAILGVLALVGLAILRKRAAWWL